MFSHDRMVLFLGGHSCRARGVNAHAPTNRSAGAVEVPLGALASRGGCR